MKKTIGVICGGRSGEHEVSLVSAQAIVAALAPEQYRVKTIGIDQQGRWWLGPDVIANLQTGKEPYGEQVFFVPDPTQGGLLRTTGSGWEPVAIDLFFPVLHGPNGEDGTIQGLFELGNVPYAGCGVLASACGMDKAVTKELFNQKGLPQVPYQVFFRSEWEADPIKVITAVEHLPGYPCFVKPANMGSSVGIAKATTQEQLQRAFADAVRYDRKIIVEKGIDAREIEVSVLGNDQAIASLPGEIEPGGEFYDYEAKYVDTRSRLLIPAPLSEPVTRRVQDLAIRAFNAVDGSGLSRVDFFLDRQTGEVWVNEINTLPGFTNISMCPKLWEATGLSYRELLSRVITLGWERYEEKQRNATKR
ncbi:MAG: D-alanine--D-alanine ligase, partial [Heliobacteriaceae bacterium]|nr:D-alanine--D-alanine ligase [Heliobacteriaceae bacterium]